jgi:hypothetical protein
MPWTPKARSLDILVQPRRDRKAALKLRFIVDLDLAHVDEPIHEATQPILFQIHAGRGGLRRTHSHSLGTQEISLKLGQVVI